MRQMFLALVVAAVGGFAAASCGSSSNKGDMGGPDMASAPADMVVAKLNCKGFGTCVYNCLLSGQGDINTCQPICNKTAKPGSGQKWFNAVICGQNYCTGNADLMNGKCVSQAIPGDMGPSPGSILCDPGVSYAACSASTYMSTVCSPCLTEARNFWVFDESVDPANPGPPTFMCPMPGNADCTAAQAQCATPFNACLNDM